MNEMARQRGLTMVSWLVVIAVVVFLAMFVLKLFPVYLENFSVRTTLNSLEKESQPLTPADLRETLRKRLDINDVTHVDMRKNVTIDTRDGKHLVQVAYEVRVPFISNVDFLVTFRDHAEVPAP